MRGAALLTAGSILASLVLLAPQAAAQDGVTASETVESGGSEILVTARKRAETVLSVPVVVSAISQDQIERFQTQDLKDLSKLVPGLSLGSSILSVGAQVSLRGVGTSSLDPGTDQSVSLNVDGLALSQGLAYASGMFDVGQIEVLKGPQALFFGKSSPGGVISIRTADPTDEFEVRGRAGYEFEARERRAELAVSGPLTPTLGARLAGTYGKQDGFYYNRSIANPALGARDPIKRRITPAEDYKIRATLLWNPSDQINMRLKVNHVYDNTLYAGTSQNALCPDGTGPVGGRQFIDPRDCKIDRNLNVVDLSPAAFPGVANNGTPFNRTRQTYGTLEINARPTPELTFTSSTGYYRVRARSLLNGAASSVGAGTISVENSFGRNQYTQEFRLTSDYSGPFNFLLGGFLERGDFRNNVLLGGNTTLGLPPVLQRGIKEVKIATDSLFGQALYKIVPELEVALGARWTSERRSQRGFNTISGAPVPVTLAVPRIGAKNLAPELTVSYRPTDDLTLFGALKRGYKSGSFNVATPPFTNENNAFGDEKVEGGEVGLKSRLFDRSLSFNLSGYLYDYTGLQVGANVQATNGVTVQRTVNAGSARVYGLEAELAYSPRSMPELTVRGAVNWNHARYRKLDNIPCYGGQTIAEGCDRLFNPAANGGAGGFTSQDRSGIALLRAPTWQANFGFDYEATVAGDWKLIFANSTQYSSRYVANLGYLFYQPSFFKVDASLTLRAPDERWELSLIGKNLNNELTTGNCANSNRANGLIGGLITGSTGRGIAGVDETGCYMDRGREMWVRLGFKF